MNVCIIYVPGYTGIKILTRLSETSVLSIANLLYYFKSYEIKGIRFIHIFNKNDFFDGYFSLVFILPFINKSILSPSPHLHKIRGQQRRS